MPLLTYGQSLDTQTKVDDFKTDHCGGVDCGDYVGGNIFILGSNITNLDGLSSITSVGGNLDIKDNDMLTNVDGLFSLTSVGGFLRISNNAMLENVEGFSALTSVGWIIIISSNNKLANLDGLSSLTSVGGYLEIDDNAMLTNINGLSAVTSVGGYLSIQTNPILATCCGVLPLLDGGGVTGIINISNNDTGCDSEAEIKSACNPAIPSLSQWGIILLSFSFLILGIVGIRQKVWAV